MVRYRSPERDPAAQDGSVAEAGCDDLARPPDYEARARDICLRLLTARARSRAELAAALTRRGVPEQPANRVLDRLGEVGLIDDAAVAHAIVEQQVGRGLARRAVAVKLRQRGVGEPEASAALDAIAADTELDAARAVAQRRLRQLAALAPEVQARRLAGQLARRGYPPSIVHRVVSEAVRDGSPGGVEFDPAEPSGLPDLEA